MSHTFTSINPATGVTIATYNASPKEEVDKALKDAQKAFAAWRKMSFKERGIVLRDIAKQIRNQKQQLAELVA